MESVDKLRGWASQFTGPYKTNERQLNDLADAIEAEVAERYIELPTDINDAPVRVGDIMSDGEYVFRVERISYYGGATWSVLDDVGTAWAACDIHHKPTTVEDVLWECCKEYHSLLVESMSDIPHEMPAPSEVIDRYAAKLRLAAGGDG